MAHEQLSRLSKKTRQNKVPQRGMGVAQLEKIILEEKQSKDVCFSRPVVGPTIPLPTSLLPVPVSVPVPVHRSGPLIAAKSDHGFVVSSSSSKPMVSNSNSGIRSRIWIDQNQDQRGYVMSSSIPMNFGGLPYESSPTVWPVAPSITIERSQHVKQPCSSSMKEPPSNQSYSSNKYSSIWPEEEKYEQIVGMKRSYPFSVENMPIPTFNCKFAPAYVSPMARSGETTSCSNGGIASLDLPIPIFREKSLSIGAKTDQPSKKHTDKNHGLTKDFLTLAPPRASTRSHSNSKEKLTPLSYGIPPYQHERGDAFGNGTQLLNQKQPLHSFFPVLKTRGNNNTDAVEKVDLDLKL